MNGTKIKWQVSLSNGETFFEDKGDYVLIPGELSPWQRLIKYIALNRLLITSISLYTDNGYRYNLPSSGNNPNFKPFRLAEKPLDYNFEHYFAAEKGLNESREINVDINEGELYTVISAIYPKYTLQLWVSENNPKNSWCVVVPSEGVK